MAEATSIAADCPLVLLPVRLETRFFANELWIRVYPDTVHVDTHEPELTQDELTWGRHFHEQLWRAAADDALNKAAWRQLAERFGAARSGWVARQLTPVNQSERPTAPVPVTQPLPVAPRFPDVPARTGAEANETWTRAPWSRVLPDRWFAVVFIGAQMVASATGQKIPDPLPVGPDPQLSITENPAGAPADAGIQWMVDFGAAEKAGMALKITLPPLPIGASRVIDRLLVVGVKNSLDAAAGAARLAELMRAHQYTGGLELLAQGTPTNNSEASPSAFTSEDSAHENSARWFFSAPRFQHGDGSDGDELTNALGVGAGVFDRSSGAEQREQSEARRMHRVIWPATWGYYLEQMLNGVFADGDIDASLKWGRDHFVDHVRARGPLPALRIGKQPYGLLPVTSLSAWQPAAGEQTEPARDNAVVNFLRRQRPVWLDASLTAPRMGRNNDPDKDFLQVFAMDAVSSQYIARNVMGERYAWHLLGYFGMFPLNATGSNETFQRWQNAHVSLATAALNQTGLNQGALASRLAMALHLEISDAVDRLARMDADGAAELVLNQLSRLINAPGLDAVLCHDGVPQPFSMIYLMARHALLLEYANAAARVLNMPARQRVEEDHIGFTQLGAFETSLGRIVRAGLHAGAAFSSPADGDLKDFRQALLELKDVPAHRLDLSLRAALDLSSHRLDGWITSLANKRLRSMRRARPAGAYLGAYGWLENLRPANPSQPAPDANAAPTMVANNPGFVHAPSLQQATTVAVLRSGHLTHAAGAKQDLLAIDLSSERARLARWLLDGVRAGQPLGALLGYRFERGLHENHPGLFLDRFIAQLRDIAPLTATRVDASGQPVESVPATHVVDGLKLFRMWKPQPDFLRTVVRLAPAPTPDEFAALEAELALLGQAVDAVSDALIAESVHQLVRGNPVRAAATLDAIERGEAPPPELEVLRTPRSGSAFTHRVIMLCASAPTAPRWTGSASLPRAAAEPALNGWVAKLLGDPRSVRCRIERVDSAGDAAPLREIRLNELRLCPLDVLYASESTDELHQSDLEQQILYQARRGVADLPDQAVLRINPGRDPSWPITDLSWGEYLELVGAARRVIGASRPLQAGDLTLDALAPNEGIDAVDLQKRADAAVTRLRRAAAALHKALTTVNATSLDPLRDAMLALSGFGIAGAVPLFAVGNDDGARAGLQLQGQALEKEANDRLARITEIERALATPGITTDKQIELQSERLRAVFAAGFVLLPRFRALNDADLTRALAASAAVQGGDPFAAHAFHQRMARVREALTNFDDALRYAEALGAGASLTLDVLQLPFNEGDRWVGLPATATQPLAAARLSVVAHLAGAVDFTKSLAGLMIDEWVEAVPNASETTGVVFQSNQPDSAPPQAILLAVPPNPATVNTWTEASLVQLLQETLDFVRMRAVTPDLLQQFSHYLPALYFSLNVANETISTDFVLPG